MWCRGNADQSDSYCDDKALVENHVKLTYHNVYAPLRNRRFFSIEELNKAIAEQMTLHNLRRMQRLPFTREERFISIDKPALKPLRAERFEIKYRCELLVGTNSFIYMGRTKNYYSVQAHRTKSKDHLHEDACKHILASRRESRSPYPFI